jgi:hypothetical protein
MMFNRKETSLVLVRVFLQAVGDPPLKRTMKSLQVIISFSYQPFSINLSFLGSKIQIHQSFGDPFCCCLHFRLILFLENVSFGGVI